MRVRSRSREGRARSRRPSGPLSVLAALLLAGAIAPACAREAPNHDLITVALANAPANLDPRVGSDEASQKLHQLLYGSLLRIGHDLRPAPELATSVDTPDDRTYLVRLRHGVRFHDGHELTAADVVHSFRSFLDPEFVSPRKGAYRLLASVVALDPWTVVFRLKEPFGSFPVNLVMGIVPAGAGAELGRQPVGTGPYQLVEFAPDDRIELAPFAEYFGGRPRNGGLTLKVVPDDTMRGLELRKGTVDLVINDLAPDIVYQLRQEGRLRVATAPGTDFAYLGFNLRDPVLKHMKVRQAIGYAINRDAIVRYLRRNLAVPAVGIVPPTSWAFEPDVFRFTHDPARARRLLDEAGFVDPDKEGPLPRLRLTLKTSTSEVYRLQAAVIQHDLETVGIAVDVRSSEFATLYADVLRGNFQMYTLQWVGVTDPDMLRRVFHSAQMPPAGFNRGFYRHPEVDRVLDAATVATDERERRALYGRAQQLIAEDAPYISLWTRTNVAVFQSDIRGVHLSPIADFTFLKDVSRERAAGAVASRSRTPPRLASSGR